MELRTLVTFRSQKFNTSERKPYFINPCCFGDDLATWLVQQLTNSGIDVDQKIGQEDFGWFLAFRAASYKHIFIVSYNPNGYWMGWLEPKTAFLSRIFSVHKKRVQPEAASAIHSILTTNGEICDVRWQFRKDFDARREDLAVSSPLG